MILKKLSRLFSVTCISLAGPGLLLLMKGVCVHLREKFTADAVVCVGVVVVPVALLSLSPDHGQQKLRVAILKINRKIEFISKMFMFHI